MSIFPSLISFPIFSIKLSTPLLISLAKLFISSYYLSFKFVFLQFIQQSFYHFQLNFILEYNRFRSLQIISWSLQQNIGARDSMKGRVHYENVVDRVMQSLQQPCADLRGTGFDSWDVTHAYYSSMLHSSFHVKGWPACYHLIISFMILFKQPTHHISFQSSFTYHSVITLFCPLSFLIFSLLSISLGLAVKCLGLLALTSEEKCKGLMTSLLL